MLVTAIKQAYEDVQRHREDWHVNSKKVKVLRENNKLKYIKWKDIRVGDIVEVLADEAFPCDLLLLYSKTEHGTAHIKTSNLDGETNLKQRSIPNKLRLFNSENEVFELNGVITCEKPNPRLYEFKGTLQIGDKI
jgi:P-type E1-E2 ATPase